MEEQIYLNNRDMSRYLQSLDSVRFSESDPYACKTQTKLELFTSLMMGRTIPISENQFLDSIGFLQNTYDMLSARSDLPKNERTELKKILPFIFSYRDNFKNIDDFLVQKFNDQNYKLSLWNSLGNYTDPEMIERRKKISKKILEGKFKFEEDKLVPESDRESAKMLRIIRKQFIRGEKNKTYSLYGQKISEKNLANKLLPEGILQIIKFAEIDLYKQLKLQINLEQDGLCPEILLDPENISQAIELIESVKDLISNGLNIKNRSHIRIGKINGNNNSSSDITFREYIDNEEKFEGILEIFDLLYNSAVAKSCNAHTESVSSARLNSSNQYVQAANSLATMAKNEITDQADIIGEYFNPTWIQDYQFNYNNQNDGIKILSEMPWEHIWEAYLDPKWRDSATNYNKALQKWDTLMNNSTTSADKYIRLAHQLDDAYNIHIDNIIRLLQKSAWSFSRNRDSNQVFIHLTTATGQIATGFATSLLLNPFKLDLFWEETISYYTGFVAEKPLTKLINLTGEWLTKGYIRKTFSRLVR